MRYTSARGLHAVEGCHDVLDGTGLLIGGIELKQRLGPQTSRNERGFDRYGNLRVGDVDEASDIRRVVVENLLVGAEDIHRRSRLERSRVPTIQDAAALDLDRGAYCA